MTKKYFGTDGIRGAINSKNINGDMFFKFGLASGTYFKSQKKKKQIAIIAKDTRLSGYTLEPALVSGLTSAGMHVYTLGPLPTNGLAMLTKGMKANTLGALLNNGESDWWQNPNNRCNIADQDYWDEDPDPDRNQVIDLDKIEVRQIVLENVATTWRDKIGAVCFGKNDQWYSGNGQLVSGTDDVIVDNFLFNFPFSITTVNPLEMGNEKSFRSSKLNE